MSTLPAMRAVLVLAFPLALNACGAPRQGAAAGAAPTAPAPAPAPQPLAASSLPVVLCDVTGSQSPLGQQAQLGALLALREAVAGGAVDGALLVDTASVPATAAERARAAAGSRGYGIGFTDSDMALAGVPAFTGAGRPFVVIGATDPTLPARCGQGTFLACFGDDAQAVAGAEFGAASFGRRAAVVFDSRSDYSRTLAGFFRTHLGSALEGSAIAEFDVASVAIPAIPPHLVEMGSAIDFVYLALGPEDVPAAIHAVRSALPVTPIVGGDSLDFPGVEVANGLPVDAVWFTTHAWLGQGADAGVAAFAESFARAFRTPPTAFAALGYDAARLAIDARRRAGSDDPSAIAAALAATRDFRGVTGRMDFSAGPVPRKDVWVVAVSGGGRSLARRSPSGVR
jgi:branched-chain amino acid transport system substrate-binding protein